jgi:hypothetical protein
LHFEIELAQEKCKQNPERCEAMKQKRKEMQEKCTKDPEACKKMREERREKMKEKCKENPERCKKSKQKPGEHHYGPHGDQKGPMDDSTK